MLTPLELAIRKRRYSIVELVLKRGANMEQRCNTGLTPLLKACKYDRLEAVKLLVQRGADITARTPNGTSCLSLAAKSGHFTVISYLLEQQSCPVNEMEENGYTALHYISLLNDTRTMEVIILKGANINAQNQDGETPAFIAAKNSRMNCLRVLLEAGADPDISTKDGECAIHEAVSQGSIDFVRMLLNHGADKSKIGKDGLTPIQRALEITPSNPSIVESLLNDYSVACTGGSVALEGQLGEEKLNKLGDEVKESICCPITFEVMRDPVIAADGHTYERAAIEEWLRQKQESPVTRQPLSASTLIPNLSIRHLVKQYISISEGQ